MGGSLLRGLQGWVDGKDHVGLGITKQAAKIAILRRAKAQASHALHVVLGPHNTQRKDSIRVLLSVFDSKFRYMLPQKHILRN